MGAALGHGEFEAVNALIARGARVDLRVAAATGRLEEARTTAASASAEDRHFAFAWAAQFGHVAIVEFLLDLGEDPNRFNPKERTRIRRPCTKQLGWSWRHRPTADRAWGQAGHQGHPLGGHTRRLGRLRGSSRDRSLSAEPQRSRERDRRAPRRCSDEAALFANWMTCETAQWRSTALRSWPQPSRRWSLGDCQSSAMTACGR